MRGINKLGVLALGFAALSQGIEKDIEVFRERKARIYSKTPLTPMQKIRRKRSKAAKQARKKNRA